MNEKLNNLNKKQFEMCLITLEMLTFETPKIYTGHNTFARNGNFLQKGKILLSFSNIGVAGHKCISFEIITFIILTKWHN